MQELTSKQKRYLRGIGQRLDVRVSVGKGGLSDAFLETVRGMLDREELIKIRLPAGPGKWRNAVATDIAESTDATCAGVVGRTALLYRPNDELEERKRINLPAGTEE